MAIVRRKLRRAAKLRFRPAPVEIDLFKQTPRKVCSGEVG
jgi:hypothetical protein